MDLSIQEVHTYNDLVKAGKADELDIVGVDDAPIIVTRLDDNDQVYFYDIVSKVKVYPGINMIEKIKKAIDRERNS